MADASTWHGGLGFDCCAFCTALIKNRSAAGVVVVSAEFEEAVAGATQAVLTEHGEVACPRCGNTSIGYEETVIDYRESGDQDPDGRTLSVIWQVGGQRDGDGTPGLICHPSEGGCGLPLTVPEGWALIFD